MTIIRNLETNSTKMRKQNATFAALAWIREQQRPHIEKAYLYAIASHIDERYQWCLKRETIAAEAGISDVSTVSKITRKLLSEGMIDVEKVPPRNGGWAHNRYHLKVPARYRVKPERVATDHPIGGETPHNMGADGHPYYPSTIPSTVPVEDKSKDTSEQQSCPLSSNSFSEKSGEVEKEQTLSPEVKKTGKLGAHFPVSAKFNHDNMSNPARVSHWWECIAEYRSDQYHANKKLTKHQSDKLWELYGMFDYKPLRALVLIEWSIAHWDAIKQSNAGWQSKPQAPTPTWVVNNIENCVDHFQATSPIKFGPH